MRIHGEGMPPVAVPPAAYDELMAFFAACVPLDDRKKKGKPIALFVLEEMWNAGFREAARWYAADPLRYNQGCWSGFVREEE